MSRRTTHIRILRTGAGSPPNWSCHALKRQQGVHLILADADPVSVGFYSACCDEACVIPPAASAAFLPALLQLCREKEVDVIIPAVDEELRRLAAARASFEATGTRLLLSGEQTLAACSDKWLFALRMRKWGLPHPLTALASEGGDRPDYPLICKPRSGRGSCGVYRTDGPGMPNPAEGRDDYLIQQYIPGAEYTADTLSGMDGTFIYGCPRRRIKTDSGISIVGETVTDEAAMDVIRILLNRLKIRGPANVQYIRPDADHLYIIEVNPRLSGGGALTQAAGIPYMEDIVRLLRGEAVPQRTARPGVKMFREWREIFVEPVQDAPLIQSYVPELL